MATRCNDFGSQRSPCNGACVAERSVVTRDTGAEFVSRGVVVIADDDDDIRVVLAMRMAAAGYEVATARDGAELLALLEEVDVPCAILVDLLMPGVLGTTVLEYIRNDPRLAGVPTAIVSGSPELAPPGFTLFVKPARFAELLSFVNEAAASRIPPSLDGRNHARS